MEDVLGSGAGEASSADAHRFKGDLCGALMDTRARFEALLQQVGDPTVIAVGRWTIAETASHVAGSADGFMASLLAQSPPERLDEVDSANARALERDPERDLGVLGARFGRGEAALVAHACEVVGDPPVTLFEGVVVPLSTALGIELGEVLVHGRDIARAARVPWRIDPAQAALTLRAYLPLLPHLLDPERGKSARLSVALRVRGMAPVDVLIRDGDLRVVDAAGQRVDCRLTVDPVVYLLLTWNRISPLPALLTGRMIISGRRPWKAFEFAGLLTN